MLARFIPAVRTFVPIVAGWRKMSYGKFLLWNVLGGIGWVVSMTVGGYFLTEMIRAPRSASPKRTSTRSCCPIVFVIIVVSALPAIWHMYVENKALIHREVARRAGPRLAAPPAAKR